MIYAIYDSAGEIRRIVSCQESQSGYQVGDGELICEVGEGVLDTTHYISGGQAIEKSALAVSVSAAEEEAVVTGLPAGLEVSFDGVIATTDDDPLTLEMDEPGTYTLRIDGGALYLDAEVEITFG